MATKSNKAAAFVDIKEFKAVQLELDQAKTVANNNIQLATFFANAQMAIDNRIMETPFKGNVKNSFFWVVANWKELIKLIEYIVDIVKQVKQKLEDLRKNAPQPDAK
jgi:hypothetical protein